jgi:F-type H+-transporting ATPase subunit delta
MAQLTKDARNFVEGVVSYIKKEGKSPLAEQKVKKYLSKVSEADTRLFVARIESAVTLDQSERSEIEKIIHGLTGRNIRAEYKVLPKLLGGVRVTIGEWILDTTLIGQLHRMKDSIL